MSESVESDPQNERVGVSPYATLSREQLEQRLAAAEVVCTAFSWSPSTADGSDIEKATHELWVRWRRISGDYGAPEDHPELSPSVISDLARQRDRTRADTLSRLFEPEEESQG